MNTSIHVMLFFVVLTALSCWDKNDKKTKDLELEPSENKETSIAPLLKIDPNEKPAQIKKIIEEEIRKVNQLLPKLKKDVIKITFNVPETPVTIWYLDTKPIKLSHGVADDLGEIDGVFEYYLHDGKVWYSDQIFAKYIFQDQELKYWLDRKWRINEASAQALNERGKNIKESVNFLMNQFK